MTQPSPIVDLASFRTAMQTLTQPEASAMAAARERNAMLTKPQGALGRLEDLAIWYAGWRDDARPVISAPQIIVFAGNHGVTAQGISAFPPEVTAQMVLNFEAGGAAINQLAKLADARLDVLPLDLASPTADFTRAPAMSDAECAAAIAAGMDAVDPLADLLVVGEMGIGNTTSAAAIATAILGGRARDWTGRGTGVDDAGVAHKAHVIETALERSGPVSDPLEALRQFGGREIAAMTGAMAAARQHRIPVILDGFIASSAALVLHAMVPASLDHVVAGHCSAEAGHQSLLSAMNKSPLLQLELRLGEGSGAALAIQILKGALACFSGMATFAEAGVSDG